MTKVALVALHAAVLLRIAQYTPVERAENMLIRDPRGTDLHVVTPEIRDEVILRLRRYAHGLNSETGAETHLGRDDRAVTALFRLEDMETIEEVMREYHETPGGWERQLARRGQRLVGLAADEFPHSAQPLLIPYLAREFFRDDLDPATVEEVNAASDDIYQSGAPASVASAYFAIGIMKMSPVFTPAVRDWAKNASRALLFQSGRDIVRYRQVMQEWWRDNAKHFEAKDYAAVKPGDPLVSPLDKVEPPVPADATGPPKGSAAQPIATIPAGESATVASTSSPLIYPMAIGLSALLIAAIALLIRRKA